MKTPAYEPWRTRLLRILMLVVALTLTTAAPSLGQAAPASAFDAQAVYALTAPAVTVVRGIQEGRPVLGSGFAVDAEGWILTAGHVARTAADLRVEFPDAGTFPAQLVGYDARRDLALLRVSALRRLPALSVARDVALGEPVAVIGAPRGRRGVMTTGQVVGISSSLPGLVPEIMIRVTADVAPGNSGGPVLNGRGEVVGLVVASNREGHGLAVSGPIIGSALSGLRAGARIDRAWIGIAGRTLTPAQARERGVAVDRGALILDIVEESPAARAGLRAGDVIVSLDGAPVDEWSELLQAVAVREPGRTVRVTIVRGSDQVQVEVTLGIRP
ncbi:MAG TPA: trypsin-like peptidase domain-containing protein [bacterium]|nr:trypsin-like peptidase domain-containing protein [bacterium]